MKHLVENDLSLLGVASSHSFQFSPVSLSVLLYFRKYSILVQYSNSNRAVDSNTILK